MLASILIRPEGAEVAGAEGEDKELFMSHMQSLRDTNDFTGGTAWYFKEPEADLPDPDADMDVQNRNAIYSGTTREEPRCNKFGPAEDMAGVEVLGKPS